MTAFNPFEVASAEARERATSCSSRSIFSARFCWVTSRPTP
jgi:hypothetical protein